MRPTEHAAAAQDDLARAQELAVQAEIAAYLAAIHSTLSTCQSDASEVYQKADGAVTELDAMRERGELGAEALDNNWLIVARAVAPPGTTVSRVVGRTRQNIRIEDESPDAMDREAKTGHLSRTLGQIRI